MGGDITTYQTTLDFLEAVFEFFDTIFRFQVIAGISLGTILTYNFLIVCVFTVFARKS